MADESFFDAWQMRYGTPPPTNVPDLGTFLTHRSIRKFAPEPIPEGMIEALVAAAQSAATSSNLQLYTMISVQDPDRREAIAKLCDNQQQVRDASWFFGFFADHHRLRRAAEAAGADPAGLDYTEFLLMATMDAALAAERMVCAAESLGIGICYIGALRNDPEGVKNLLGLPQGTFGCFGLCLGWPAEPVTSKIKPRLAQQTIWHREVYSASQDVSEYDARMKAFYEGEKMRGDVTWSMRSGRRVDGQHMTGREVLKAWLEGQGMGLR